MRSGESRRFHCSVLIFAWMVAASGFAQSRAEYQVKAAYIYDFVKTTDWPDGILSKADSPLMVGVFGGNEDFVRVLQATIAGKKINGHALAVRHLLSTGDLKSCQVLFFRGFEQGAPSAMAEVSGAPILLIGEDPDFLSRGGMINLVPRKGRPRNGGMTFELNPEAIEKAGLRYRSEASVQAKAPGTAIHSDGTRAIKSQILPSFPEIARNMSLKGTVQLQAVVRADGSVKEVRILGGHPALALAAQEAVMKWKYENDSKETVETVKITFGP